MTIPIDDYSPRYIGDLGNPLQIVLADHSGNPYNISGNNMATDFTISLIPIDGGTTIVGGGTWVLTGTGADGGVEYIWVAGDVGTVGLFAIRGKAKILGEWVNFDAKNILFKDPAQPG